MEILIAFFLFAQEVTKNGHELGEEIVRGQAASRIDEQKIFLSPQFNQFTPLDSILSEERYIFDKRLSGTIDELNGPILNLHSEYLRTPTLTKLMYGSIALFVPKFAKTVSSWELVMTDGDGEVIRRYAGQGLPPSMVAWDGRTDAGGMCNMGEVYDYVFTAFDAVGNPTRIAGRPYAFNGIVYEEKNTKIIALATGALFDQDLISLTDDALDYFDEVANLIKENFHSEVVVYSYSDHETIANSCGNVVVDEIARRTVLPKGSIKTAPRFVAGSDSRYSKIEIIIQ